MIKLTFVELAKAVNGQHFGDNLEFSQVSIDSRNIESGALFIAIKGAQFDGHDYIQQALDKGACGVLVHQKTTLDCPQVVVEDTTIALGQMAAVWRQKSHATVIALTGSNGKTSVKEMIRAILGIAHQVHATQGNMNNEIGLPLTLLRLQEADYAVLEMGAAKQGDIDYLSRIAHPDISLLNNAGIAHMAGFGDQTTLAKTKAEIMNGLTDEGVFICDGDSRWLTLWRDLAAGKRQITFGFLDTNDIRSPKPATTVWTDKGFTQQFDVITPNGLMPIELPLAGLHNQKNALAACAVAWQLNIPAQQIQQGLSGMRPVAGRLNPTVTQAGIRIIDDSYNANPSSVKVAIQFLASLEGRKILVLGDMAELGKDAVKYHQNAIDLALELGIEQLYLYGDIFKQTTPTTQVSHFADKSSLIEQLKKNSTEKDIILIKGSRSSGMDTVAQALNGEKDT